MYYCKISKKDQSWPCKLQQMIADVTDVTDADNQNNIILQM